MKKSVIYNLRASEERMLETWRHRNDKPVAVRKTKKKTKKKPRIEINHAKGLTYKQFIDSDYWKRVRKKVLERDKFQCIVCHLNKNLQVHHATYIHHGFEHKHLNDLMTLCNDCHKITHGIVTDKIPANF